jgi:hypothetical protein
VRDPKLIKKCVEVVILTTPIGLNMENFMLEKAFDMRLELNEHIEHIRFAFEEIKPSKSTMGINKTDIIVVTTNKGLGRAPYIRKMSSRGLLTIRVDETKGS